MKGNYVIELSSGKKLDKAEFIHYFEKKVFRTIRRFGMIDIRDNVLVACSGGKDSNVALYVLNKLCKERKQKIEAIAIDEGMKGYRDKLIEGLKKLCKKEDIKLNVLSFKKEYGFTLDKIHSKIKRLKLSSCHACSILKRWSLNKFAREKKFNVIATGHSMDDEAETIILNYLKGNAKLLAKLGPLSGIERKKEFIQRIKPLYLCPEKEIILYAKLKKLPLSLEVCPKRGETFRVEVRNFLRTMEKRHIEVKNAIVNTMLQILPCIKENFRGGSELKKCKICKEPCSNETCKRCQILKLLKS